MSRLRVTAKSSCLAALLVVRSVSREGSVLVDPYEQPLGTSALVCHVEMGSTWTLRRFAVLLLGWAGQQGWHEEF